MSAAMAPGFLKRAAAPVPSVAPEVPSVPTKSEITPVEITTLRMPWLLVSATYRSVPETATPSGLLRRPVPAAPTAVPKLPLVPASVVTVWSAITILRIMWLNVSAT